MKSATIFTILTLALGLTQACKTTKVTKSSSENFPTQLTVFQNGIEYPINNFEETIELSKEAFSLRFNNKKYNSENKKFYTAQIAAFIDKSEFDKLKTGVSKSVFPCFAPGTGMAPDKSNKYESLIFNNAAHHYTFYESPESTRLNLLKDGGEVLRLEFEINALYYNKESFKMTETDLKEFYIAILIDKNLNENIDEGELNKLTIKIK